MEILDVAIFDKPLEGTPPAIARWLFTAKNGMVMKKCKANTSVAALKQVLLSKALKWGEENAERAAFATAVLDTGECVPIDEDSWRSLLLNRDTKGDRGVGTGPTIVAVVASIADQGSEQHRGTTQQLFQARYRLALGNKTKTKDVMPKEASIPVPQTVTSTHRLVSPSLLRDDKHRYSETTGFGYEGLLVSRSNITNSAVESSLSRLVRRVEEVRGVRILRLTAIFALLPSTSTTRPKVWLQRAVEVQFVAKTASTHGSILQPPSLPHQLSPPADQPAIRLGNNEEKEKERVGGPYPQVMVIGIPVGQYIPTDGCWEGESISTNASPTEQISLPTVNLTHNADTTTTASHNMVHNRKPKMALAAAIQEDSNCNSCEYQQNISSQSDTPLRTGASAVHLEHLECLEAAPSAAGTTTAGTSCATGTRIGNKICLGDFCLFVERMLEGEVSKMVKGGRDKDDAQEMEVEAEGLNWTDVRLSDRGNLLDVGNSRNSTTEIGILDGKSSISFKSVALARDEAMQGRNFFWGKTLQKWWCEGRGGAGHCPDLAALEIGPAAFYREVSVCHVCYSVYRKIDKLRGATGNLGHLALGKKSGEVNHFACKMSPLGHRDNKQTSTGGATIVVPSITDEVTALLHSMDTRAGRKFKDFGTSITLKKKLSKSNNAAGASKAQEQVLLLERLSRPRYDPDKAKPEAEPVLKRRVKSQGDLPSNRQSCKRFQQDHSQRLDRKKGCVSTNIWTSDEGSSRDMNRARVGNQHGRGGRQFWKITAAGASRSIRTPMAWQEKPLPSNQNITTASSPEQEETQKPFERGVEAKSPGNLQSGSRFWLDQWLGHQHDQQIKGQKSQAKFCPAPDPTNNKDCEGRSFKCRHGKGKTSVKAIEILLEGGGESYLPANARDLPEASAIFGPMNSSLPPKLLRRRPGRGVKQTHSSRNLAIRENCTDGSKERELEQGAKNNGSSGKGADADLKGGRQGNATDRFLHPWQRALGAKRREKRRAIREEIKQANYSEHFCRLEGMEPQRRVLRRARVEVGAGPEDHGFSRNKRQWRLRSRRKRSQLPGNETGKFSPTQKVVKEDTHACTTTLGEGGNINKDERPRSQDPLMQMHSSFSLAKTTLTRVTDRLEDEGLTKGNADVEGLAVELQQCLSSFQDAINTATSAASSSSGARNEEGGGPSTNRRISELEVRCESSCSMFEEAFVDLLQRLSVKARAVPNKKIQRVDKKASRSGSSVKFKEEIDSVETSWLWQDDSSATHNEHTGGDHILKSDNHSSDIHFGGSQSKNKFHQVGSSIGETFVPGICPQCGILPVARRCLDCHGNEEGTGVEKVDGCEGGSWRGECKDSCSACFVRYHHKWEKQGHRFLHVVMPAPGESSRVQHRSTGANGTNISGGRGGNISQKAVPGVSGCAKDEKGDNRGSGFEQCSSCGDLAAARRCRECKTSTCTCCHFLAHKVPGMQGHTVEFLGESAVAAQEALHKVQVQAKERCGKRDTWKMEIGNVSPTMSTCSTGVTKAWEAERRLDEIDEKKEAAQLLGAVRATLQPLSVSPLPRSEALKPISDVLLDEAVSANKLEQSTTETSHALVKNAFIELPSRGIENLPWFGGGGSNDGHSNEFSWHTRKGEDNVSNHDCHSLNLDDSMGKEDQREDEGQERHYTNSSKDSDEEGMMWSPLNIPTVDLDASSVSEDEVTTGVFSSPKDTLLSNPPLEALCESTFPANETFASSGVEETSLASVSSEVLPNPQDSTQEEVVTGSVQVVEQDQLISSSISNRLCEQSTNLSNHGNNGNNAHSIVNAGRLDYIGSTSNERSTDDGNGGIQEGDDPRLLRQQHELHLKDLKHSFQTSRMRTLASLRVRLAQRRATSAPLLLPPPLTSFPSGVPHPLLTSTRQSSKEQPLSLSQAQSGQVRRELTRGSVLTNRGGPSSTQSVSLGTESAAHLHGQELAQWITSKRASVVKAFEVCTTSTDISLLPEEVQGKLDHFIAGTEVAARGNAKIGRKVEGKQAQGLVTKTGEILHTNVEGDMSDVKGIGASVPEEEMGRLTITPRKD